MGCKECHKDSSREDKCDRTLQQLLDDDSRGEEGKSRRLTDINGLCSGNYGCGHAIEAHTNGTTEPQELSFLTRAEFLEAMKEQQEALVNINEKLDAPDHSATATVKTHHQVALATQDRGVSDFLLTRPQENALLKRLSLTFGGLVELLRKTRNQTRGLAEVTAVGSHTGSVQKLQRGMLAKLASKLQLRVVKEVAVSSDYEIGDKKKRTYGSVDHVLVSRTLAKAVKDYSYSGASSTFQDTEHTYRPPFFALLGWEAKSRIIGGPTGTVGSEVTTDATPGKRRTSSTMTQQNIVQSSFYAKGLKEWNNVRYVEQSDALDAGTEEGQRCLPMIVSDSYCFVFQKRYLKYQVQTQQLNMDQDAEDIARLLLWALHEACELDRLYYPPKQGDNRLNKENGRVVIQNPLGKSNQGRSRRLPLTPNLLSKKRNPFTIGEKMRFFLSHNTAAEGK